MQPMKTDISGTFVFQSVDTPVILKQMIRLLAAEGQITPDEKVRLLSAVSRRQQ